MKQISGAVFIILLVLLGVPVCAMEKLIEIGMADGFAGAHIENVVLKPGKGGTLDAYLSDTLSNQPVTRDAAWQGEEAAGGVDLHLSFDREYLMEDTWPYEILGNDLTISMKSAKRGSGAAAFQFDSKGLVLAPQSDALCAAGKMIRDFSLEFWLYPATLAEGETIFLWEGTTRQGGEIIQQEARIFIRGRKIVFRFMNFFMPPGRGRFTVELEGSKTLIPRTWAHHLLRFDGTTGLIEYIADGELDAVTYANQSFRESGSVYLPYTGNTPGTRVTIGKGFTGLLDEFILRRDTDGGGSLTKYGKGKKGTIKSAIYDLEYVDSQLISVDASYKTPAESAIFFYYRMSNEKVSREDLKADWIPFVPGSPFPDAKGRYLQFLFELYPDGTGNESPVLSDVTVRYEPDLPPLPPSGLRAKALDGSVILSWNPVSDPDIKGYLVFYGDEPGTYFGEGAAEGASPIDVGNTTTITLTGLSNGSLYYFSVMAYDSSIPPHRSGFSREVNARPSRLYGSGK